MPSVMLSAVLEEEPDLYEAFPPHVDPSGITILTDSPPGNYYFIIFDNLNHACDLKYFTVFL